MNPDVSVAPEIAQLMEPPRPVTSPVSTTIGELARELKNIAGSPDRWWSLVRFDAAHPGRVTVPVHAADSAEDSAADTDTDTDTAADSAENPTAGDAYEAWLSILPPAATDHEECHCDVVMVVAGELTEQTSPKPLVPGQVRVHGGPGGHRAVNTGDGYTVSLHLRGGSAQ